MYVLGYNMTQIVYERVLNICEPIIIVYWKIYDIFYIRVSAILWWHNDSEGDCNTLLNKISYRPFSTRRVGRWGYLLNCCRKRLR